jgi:hypothetical protein
MSRVSLEIGWEERWTLQVGRRVEMNASEMLSPLLELMKEWVRTKL